MGWCGRRTPDRYGSASHYPYGEPEGNLLTGPWQPRVSYENSGRAGG